MNIDRLDHLVLNVRDIDATLAFYQTVLGMDKVVFGEDRAGLVFGRQKINLHQLGHEPEAVCKEPEAMCKEPEALDKGSERKTAHVRKHCADLCFIIKQPVLEAIEHLKVSGVEVIEGPVVRTAATGKIVSAYFRDPDYHVIEVSNYIDELCWR